MVERISFANPTGAFSQAHSKDQIASAKDNGCSIGGYMWLYATGNPRIGIRGAIELAQSCGIDLPVLWIDVETYTDGSIPSPLVIAEALDECDLFGIEGGIYTSSSMWAKIHNPDFSQFPLWVANYYPIPRPDLEGVPLFANWVRGMVFGHQWTSDPIDRSVFQSRATLSS